MSKLNIFVPLTKIDVENRLVYGVVAEEVVDNSGEVFDYEKSKPYFQKWSANAELTSNGLSKGNLREMHGKTAAGKLTDLAFDDANRRIECCAKVVDDMAWKKCLEGVYTGFSMGGRYAEKWVEKADGGERKKYAGDPAEISLVDKPCIPTATFQLVKADGIVEERHFSSIIGEDTGDEVMKVDYTPSNDELAARGQELAKAAGKDPASWLDFADEARTQLVAEHVEKAGKTHMDKKDHKDKGTAEEGEDKGDFEEDADAGPKPGEKGVEGEEEDPEDGEDADMKEKSKDDDADDEDPEAADDEDPEAAEKSDNGTGDPVEQGWRSTDGSFHLKKADAVARNKMLKAAAAQPETLLDAVGALAKTVADVTGELGEEETVEKSDLVRYAEFFEGASELAKAENADGQELNKSMYTLERMARLLREAGSLQISVSKEQKREGDGSEVAAMIGIAVGQLGDTLLAMAKEEVDELMMTVANDGVGPGDEVMVISDCYYELAASTLGLEKADFDELVKAAGAKKAQHVQSMHDKMMKMGAKCSPMEKADGDDMNKMDGEMAELRKRAEDAEKQIAEALPLIKSLMADVEKIKMMPQPSAPRTNVVEKSDDGKEVQQVRAVTAESLLEKFSPEDLAMAAIRLGQQNGVTMTARGSNPRQG